MKKVLLWMIVVIILAGGSFPVFHFFIPTTRIQSIYLVPENAVFIIETEEPFETWEKISNSAIWAHLCNNVYFAKITESTNKLDSIINSNRRLFKLLGSRKVMISAHMYKRNSYDFLYIVDLQKASRLIPVKNFIYTIIGDAYKITKRDYHKQEIIELFNKKSRETLYLSFINNQMVASYTHLLVEASIDHFSEPVIGRDINYIDIDKRIAGNDMLRLCIHYKFLNDYLNCFLNENNEYVNSLSKSLLYTGLSFDLRDDGLIKMKGYSNVNDTIDSYLLAMLLSGKGVTNITKIAPQRTAIYLGIGFDSFLKFFENFEEILKKNPKSFAEYESNKINIEKRLKINIKDNFISWIDDELAFIQTQPVGLGKENEFAVVLKAKNIDKAKENLSFINKQIKKNTPVEFKEVNYEGYTINFLSIKGFFKLILGKMFSKLEKPYFTIIEDFVIFSNHPQTLKSIIDDYKANKTLAMSDEFKNFYDNFNNVSNIFVYIQTPVLFKNLEGFVNEETWNKLNENKDYITCFSQIGFQLEKAGNMFKTKLISHYSDVKSISAKEKKYYQTDTAYSTFRKEVLKEIEEDDIMATENISLDDLNVKKYKDFYENGKLKIEVGIKNGLKNGAYREYYESGKLKIKGKYKDDKRDGVWILYDEYGEIVAKIKYEDGKVLQ